jgi:uncharacterized integral membrane protein
MKVERVKSMATCPKCGTRVTEAMSFCPNCGASLKATAPVVQPAAPAPPPAPTPQYGRGEKGEKGEKREKSEKGEKHEKQGGFTGAIIAGLVLIIVGIVFAIQQMNLPGVNPNLLWAVFFVIIGIVVILAYVLGLMGTRRRSPST